uniref:Uncharacterized protein n=1 Tax=uncultured marine virus TaxID=186617 RepID=A0A0F7L489_9VIRU|nr:hypothetical protein [uncultured marine virus]
MERFHFEGERVFEYSRIYNGYVYLCDLNGMTEQEFLDSREFYFTEISHKG